MKLAYTFILISLLNTTYSQILVKAIPDSICYEFINSYCKGQLKRVHKIPMRHMYDYEIESAIDTNKLISGIDIFLDRIKENDTTKYFINNLDYPFLRNQIVSPEIKYFDHKKINNAKVKRKQSYIPNTYAISVPLFTIDFQSAILTRSYGGMSRTYLYHKNPFSNEWELVTLLWQNGS